MVYSMCINLYAFNETSFSSDCTPPFQVDISFNNVDDNPASTPTMTPTMPVLTNTVQSRGGLL